MNFRVFFSNSFPLSLSRAINLVFMEINLFIFTLILDLLAYYLNYIIILSTGINRFGVGKVNRSLVSMQFNWWEDVGTRTPESSVVSVSISCARGITQNLYKVNGGLRSVRWELHVLNNRLVLNLEERERMWTEFLYPECRSCVTLLSRHHGGEEETLV